MEAEGDARLTRMVCNPSRRLKYELSGGPRRAVNDAFNLERMIHSERNCTG